MEIKIYCEGVTDQFFIADCLETIYECVSLREDAKSKKHKITFPELKLEIIEFGGCTKLGDPIYFNNLIANSENGGKNIVIFDADKNGFGNNGFDSCCQKLDSLIKDKNLDFAYYIWPNHKDDGKIESIFEKMIPVDKQQVIDCIDSHMNCITYLSGTIDVKIPEVKEKVNFYLHTLKKSNKPHERNYKDEGCWNLNFDDNIDLKSLKSFLLSEINITPKME